VSKATRAALREHFAAQFVPSCKNFVILGMEFVLELLWTLL
jgi:hypothetical protein